MIETECEILRRVKHPNIVSMIETFDTDDKLYLIMDLCVDKLRWRPLLNHMLNSISPPTQLRVAVTQGHRRRALRADRGQGQLHREGRKPARQGHPRGHPVPAQPRHCAPRPQGIDLRLARRDLCSPSLLTRLTHPHRPSPGRSWCNAAAREPSVLGPVGRRPHHDHGLWPVQAHERGRPRTQPQDGVRHPGLRRYGRATRESKRSARCRQRGLTCRVSF